MPSLAAPVQTSPATFLSPATLSPAAIVSQFYLQKDDWVADFGSGHGFFTIALADAVGPEGRVYAIDIQKASLDVLRAKAQTARLLNIHLIWGNVDAPLGSKLRNEILDFVLVANTLFQCEQKEVAIEEASRILKSGGKLAIIEWSGGKIPFGPPPELRIPPETVKDIATKIGFESQGEFNAGTHHYGLLFIKR